ncbi:hypothetical protein [Thiolapillus sp.]|uniref:hypothetical protein n=1 Tax=Thiolapillus sp. TaxID=2017437 RepID=UPI003AF4BCC4
MQGRIAIFDGYKPLKMAESENRIFPIPRELRLKRSGSCLPVYLADAAMLANWI